MGEDDDRDKAEKLAAAKKRFEQLKKQKGKNHKAVGVKGKDATQEAQVDTSYNKVSNADTSEDPHLAFTDGANDEQPSQSVADEEQSHNRQPSLSLQSKMRSSSFRRASVSQGTVSPSANEMYSPDIPIPIPDGDSVNSIYRKQAARLDELEKENKRLAKEAQDYEKKWKQTEEELENLQEASGEVAELKSRVQKADSQMEEHNRIKQENTSLQRQNSQLQSQTFKKHVSSTSQATVSASPLSSLQAQLDSKSSAIESMEMEISNLRAQVDKSSSLLNAHSEQVSALRDKLRRAEGATEAAQREVVGMRKDLERASEKAVREGSERTSADTKIRGLEREAEVSQKSAEESLKRVQTLEKKLTALITLHRDVDGRRLAGEKDREKLEKDASDMQRRLVGLENENLRLREERERARKREAGGADDEGVDAMEDEERQRFETKVRGLEGEVHELRRGVWRDRRRELGLHGEDGMTSPSSKFDDIDLTGGSPSYRRQSAAGSRSNFANVLSSGLNAFTGGDSRQHQEVFEVDDDFDEEAFRLAKEEEAKKRIERVRELKRELKDWKGWRMDIADIRVGSTVTGEIFDV